MSIDLVQITGPVYLLIALGYVAVRQQWVSREQVLALGTVVARFCVPAMLVRTLAQQPLERTLNIHFLGPYALGSLLAMGTVGLVARRLLGSGHSLAAIQALGASSSNSLFVGFPIIQPLLGVHASLALVLAQLVENLLMIPLAFVLADAQRGKGRIDMLRATLLTLLRNPIIGGVVAGLLLSALHITLPAMVDKSLAMLTNMASPASLFFIGGALVGLRTEGAKAAMATVALGKLMLHPLCVAGVMLLWHPAEPALHTAAVLFAAMPMMSIYPVIGQRYQVEGFCAGALLAATVLSVVTVNAWIVGLAWLGMLPG